MKRFGIILILLSLLAACGQSGRLYMPTKGPQDFRSGMYDDVY